MERFVQTIEDGTWTLVVGSDLPPSYWPYAALMVGYLHQHLPTTTLPKNQTLFKVMTGKKPNLQHLYVWDCCAYPIQPTEIQGKGDNEENRVGWGCVDLNGRYKFSNDVVFDKSSCWEPKDTCHLP